MRERFVLTDDHWLTFDVEIKNGNVNILIIEPLGQKKRHHSTLNVLEIVSDVFPNASIFFSKDQRQHTDLGCSVFSLDDVMHLVTVENYLEKKNLFEYFIDQNKEPESFHTKPNIQIIPVDLPLSLMRTKQHIELKTQVIPLRDKEKNFRVNKRGQTALESIAPSFKPRDDHSAKQFNNRLNEKLHKMAVHNLAYLTSHSIEEITQSAGKHTLEGFKENLLASSQKMKKQLLEIKNQDPHTSELEPSQIPPSSKAGR